MTAHNVLESEFTMQLNLDSDIIIIVIKASIQAIDGLYNIHKVSNSIQSY